MSWSPKVRRGEDQPNAGTSNATAEQIRRDWQTGEYKQRELAEKHGVSLSIIKKITAGYHYT